MRLCLFLNCPRQCNFDSLPRSSMRREDELLGVRGAEPRSITQDCLHPIANTARVFGWGRLGHFGHVNPQPVRLSVIYMAWSCKMDHGSITSTSRWSLYVQCMLTSLIRLNWPVQFVQTDQWLTAISHDLEWCDTDTGRINQTPIAPKTRFWQHIDWTMERGGVIVLM